MDGQNYVVFHNDGNDSYMNSTANFRGADVGTTFIDLFFASATFSSLATSGYDKIRLTVSTTSKTLISESAFASPITCQPPPESPKSISRVTVSDPSLNTNSAVPPLPTYALN